MVAHLVRLKLTLLRNGLRRSPWQVVGMVLGALYGLGVLVSALSGLVLLAVPADDDLRRTVLVLLGALLVAGWWVVPLVAFGLDATLDLDRFATSSLRRRHLVVGLALASVVGVPGLVTLLGAVATAFVWWRSPVAVVVGVTGGLLAVATAVVGARLLTTALGPVLGNRRLRDLLAVVAIVPLMLLGPILAGVGTGLEAAADRLPAAADVVGWTPFGAPWALAADAADGAWGRLALRLGLVLVVVVALVLAWDRAVAAALVRPARGTAGGGRTSGLGLLGRVPSSPTAAVAARCLVYWRRDPRYSAGVVVVPLIPVVFAFAGGEGLVLAAGPVVGYVVGWAISTDVAYDHTAFWTHLAAPLRGVEDRVGRVLATAVIGVPTVVVVTVVTVGLAGRWDLTVPLLALSLGVHAAALGLASIASAKLVVPVPKPGQSPFATPQGGSTAAMVSQLAGTLALGAVVAPAAGLTVAAVVSGSAGLAAAAALVSLVTGVTALVLGVRAGASLYDRQAPELLQRLVAMA